MNEDKIDQSIEEGRGEAAPSALFSDIIIGSSEELLRQEVRSRGTGSTRFSPAVVLSRSDVVSNSFYLNEKPACAASRS